MWPEADQELASTNFLQVTYNQLLHTLLYTNLYPGISMVVRYNGLLFKQEIWHVIYVCFVHSASDTYWKLIWKVSSFF